MTHSNATSDPASSVLSDLTIDDIAEISGGFFPLIPVMAYVAGASVIGALCTALYLR